MSVNLTIILSIIGFFVVLGFITNALSKKRTQALSELALRLGLSFSNTSPLFDRHRNNFWLFERGRNQSVSNVMSGSKDGCQVEVFEFRYVTGHGKSKQTNKKTVVAVTDSRCTFPHFLLEPENFFHKIGTVFGMQDLDFDEYPEFSSAFVLKGEPESAVRAVFTPDIVRAMLERRKLSVEAHGDTMLSYLNNKTTLPIDEFEPAIRESIILKNTFSRR